MNTLKILLLEDDLETAEFIADGLKVVGHHVVTTGNGTDGMAMAMDENWDLLIVDRMLPGMDGIAIVKRIREENITMPVLFLTTMGGVNDRVAGLNAGGDDYLIKPFAMAELVARVAALGRRPIKVNPDTILRLSDLEMDLIARTVRRDGNLLELQPREFQLLEYLLRNSNEVVTRNMLLEKVFGMHFDPKTNFIESHISRLRAKLNQYGDGELIHTIRATGYCARVAPH